MIFLSLKTYKEATGANVIRLLSSVKKVSQETNVPIITLAQPTDIYRIKNELGIEVWSQHMDPIEPGRNFGFISPLAIKEAGATGVAINHSEHPIAENKIKETIDKAKQYGLKTLVIAQTVEDAIKFSLWDSDYILYEKPDLIAGTVSMIDQQADSIKDLLTRIKKPLIIGAGIQDGQDVKQSVAIGAAGIGLATYFVTAPDPEVKLRELADGFKV